MNIPQYSKPVIDHGTSPRNMHTMDDPDGRAVITGPCGDTMEFFLHVSDKQIITNVSFRTDGCITSIASGSMAVEMSIGQTIQTARAIMQRDILEKLEGLPKESEHCALLAANTLHGAIDDFALMNTAPWKRIYRK